MNRAIGRWTLKPEQLQVLNALLVLPMIPLFDKVIYPALRRAKVRFEPLKRMGVGMLCLVLAFLLASLVQLRIDSSVLGSVADDPSCPSAYDPTDADGDSTQKALCCVSDCVSVFWQLPQYIVLTVGEVLFSVTGMEFCKFWIDCDRSYGH